MDVLKSTQDKKREYGDAKTSAPTARQTSAQDPQRSDGQLPTWRLLMVAPSGAMSSPHFHHDKIICGLDSPGMGVFFALELCWQPCYGSVEAQSRLHNACKQSSYS